MSLFGLRPRYTSRVITVLTGVLIVLFTLGSLLLVSESVRQALFGMDELRATVASLSDDVAEKNDEVASLEEQRQQLAEGLAGLRQENSSLQGQNSTWKRENEKLAEENQALQEEQAKLRATNKTLSENNSVLREAGGNIYESYLRLRQSEITFHLNDNLGSRIIDVTQPAEQVQAQLKALVDEANARVREDGTAQGVQVRKWDDDLGWVDTDTLIDAVVESFKNYPEVKSVIVELRAQKNTTANEFAEADFTLINNVLIYNAGDIVARRVFDGTDDKAVLFEKFSVEFLGKDVRNAALARGLVPVEFSYVGMSEAYSLVEKISSFNSAVAVVAYARTDCWTRGPLDLEFKIQPVFGQ